MRVVTIAIACILACACGSEDDSDALDIPDRPLSGKIAGQAWEAKVGETNPTLSGDELWSQLFGEALELCKAFSTGSDLPSVLISIPKAPGDYRFDNHMNGTFYVPPNTNLVATRGRLVVEEVGQATVRGGLAMKFGDDSDVSGKFTVTICP